MTEADVASPTLELLRRLNTNIEVLTLEVGDLKARMSDVEQGVASTSARMAGVEVSMAGVIKRMDRMDERLARIERRLDLRDESDS